jgi:hypothetical protein
VLAFEHKKTCSLAIWKAATVLRQIRRFKALNTSPARLCPAGGRSGHRVKAAVREDQSDGRDLSAEVAPAR